MYAYHISYSILAHNVSSHMQVITNSKQLQF